MTKNNFVVDVKFKSYEATKNGKSTTETWKLSFAKIFSLKQKTNQLL